jgi:hypothetical protein
VIANHTLLKMRKREPYRHHHGQKDYSNSNNQAIENDDGESNTLQEDIRENDFVIDKYGNLKKKDKDAH